MHQGQARQPVPKPASAKAALMHREQDQKPLLRPATAKAAFVRDNAPVSTPQSLHFTIYVRSFESSARFARPMTSRGDNRTFTTKVGDPITARIHLIINVDIDLIRKKITFITNARSSETHQYNFPFYPFTYERKGTAQPSHTAQTLPGKYPQSYHFNVQAAEPIMDKIPVVGRCTPNITLNGSINIQYNNDKLFVKGEVNGDGFPDAECFIADSSGKAVMLGTFKHGPMGSPIWDLPGNGNKLMMRFDASIDLTCAYSFVWGRSLNISDIFWGHGNLPTTTTRLGDE